MNIVTASTPPCVAVCHDQIDALEAWLANQPRPSDQTIHTFTPGLYSRTFIMPAGAVYTSKIHKTEHQFVVSEGHVTVKDVLTGEWADIRAPHLGITKPGARRVLIVHEKTIWTTFHPTTETDLVRLEEQLIEPHEYTLALAKRRLT